MRKVNLLKIKKQWLIVGILSVIVLISTLFLLKKKEPMIIGVYDNENKLSQEKGIALISEYIAWNKESDYVSIALNRAIEQKRSLLLTIEPWPDPPGFSHEFNDDLLRGVINGKDNDQIKMICGVLGKSLLPIYIRWGHEMELTNSRYPWANTTPELYVNAYHHFVDICKIMNKENNFKFVWSPAGEDGLEKYWPGAEYVDLIGLSLYSFDQYDQKYLGHQRSFAELMGPKYDRIKKYKKPILIAEMGVTGSDEYKLQWLGAITKDLSKYKLLRGIVYFDSMDPNAFWEEGLINPDWRLPKNGFSFLIGK